MNDPKSKPISSQSSSQNLQDRVIELVTPWIKRLGYQIIYLEIQSHRQKILRVFIDHLDHSLDPSSDGASAAEKTIGIEDCVRVSKALDETLDQLPEFEEIIPGPYELEVSSPGLDRPLRTERDFERFKGEQARIHSFRPLSSEELENNSYQVKNPKQKNFLGVLAGCKNGKVALLIPSGRNHLGQKSHSTPLTQPKKKKSETKEPVQLKTNSEEGEMINIPLPLISKANLEPQISFEDSDERE